MNDDEKRFYGFVVKLHAMIEDYTTPHFDTARVSAINEFVDDIQITLQELCEGLSDDEFKTLHEFGIDVSNWLPDNSSHYIPCRHGVVGGCGQD